jgi:methyl-accepting chemotaxis protein
MKNLTLRAKLVITFLFVIIVPLLISTVAVYINANQIFYESLKAETTELVDETAMSIDAEFKGYQAAVELLSKDVSFRNAFLNPENDLLVEPSLKKMSDAIPQVLWSYIGYSDKRMYINPYSALPADYDPTSRPWYTMAMEKQTFIWTPPYLDAAEGTEPQMVISGAYPLKYGSDWAGVLTIDLTLNSIVERMANVKFGEKGYAVLIDQDNNTVTHPNPDLIGKPIPVPELADFIANNTSGVYEYEYDGAKKIAVLQTIESTGWKILGALDRSEISVQSNKIIMLLVIIALIVIILGVIIAFLFTKSMSNDIKKLSDVISYFKNGNFSQSIDRLSSKDMNQIGHDLNDMAIEVSTLISEVKMVIGNINESSTHLVREAYNSNMSAQEVANAIEEVARGATQQAMDSDNSSKLSVQMGDNINKLTDGINKMIVQSQKAIEANANGVKAVESLKTTSEENTSSTHRTSSAINNLDSKSREISTIVETISSIADQTNLLALNASIEAARAGEHGRGFAVVAEEIRKLAEGSSDSADLIKNIVTSIQHESQNTVKIMNEVTKRNDEQNESVNLVNNSFREIYDSIDGMKSMIEGVYSELEVLNVNKNEILSSITSIASVSEEAAAASEEVSASMDHQTEIGKRVDDLSKSLKDLAVELEDKINKFTV